MSCTRCIYRVAIRPIHLQSRSISTSTALRYAATPDTAQEPFTNPPDATTASKPKPSALHIASAAPAGTVLKGLNYFKNKQDPIALEDHEYPDWLWRVLDEKKGDPLAGEDVGDLYSKSKKERRSASKRAAKLAAMLGSIEERIPIDEQTVDLPFTASTLPNRHVVSAVGGIGKGPYPTVVIGGEDGIQEITFEQAMKARDEVKREKRRKNRAAIKERNFLGGL